MAQKHCEYIITENESQLIRIVKLICAVLVVFIHAMPAPDHSAVTLSTCIRFIWIDCVCSCAVPIFFILSGVLLFRKPFVWKKNLQKKARTLLAPYLLISTFWFIFLIIVQSNSLTSRFFAETRYLRVTSWRFTDWVQAYTMGLVKEPDSWYSPAMAWLWFLRDLFVLNLLAPLLKRIVNGFPKLWFSLLGILWIVVGTLNGSWYRPICALLFFSAGYVAVKYDIHFKDLKRIDARLLLCTFVVCCATGYICHACNRFAYGVTNMLCILSGGCLLIRMAEYLMTRYPRNPFVLFAPYSMAIYLFHEKSLTIITKIAEKLTGGVIGLTVESLVALIVIAWSICIAKLLEKYQPRIYKILVGGR